jgi:hypothetical protein
VLTTLGDDLRMNANRIGKELLASRALEPGAIVVLVSVSTDLGHVASNFVKLHKL